MKSIKFKLRKSRNFYEFLSIKEINKKVKEPLFLKDKDKEKEIEYNLYLIIKSLNNILSNFSCILFSNNDNSKQELNYLDIEEYLKNFHSKPYYQYKVYPLIEILKQVYLKSKKEKSFLNSVKEMNITVNEENKITETQIDCLNYILIIQYEKLLLLDQEIYDIFVYLKDIFSFFKDEYKYLFDYYLLIQLHTYNLLTVHKSNENNKNNLEKKKYISTTKILYDIIYKTNNTILLEFAFLLFCKYYLHFRDNSFVFLPINKWVFLILKLLKGEINLINDRDKDKEYYSLCKNFHLKYTLGELERNKKREKSPEESKISIKSTKNMPKSTRSSLIGGNLKLSDRYENASDFLEEKTYESYPKELHLLKGPSEIFIINLFKYNEMEKENKKKKKEFYENQKMELIQGALIIADKILKFKYDRKDYNDYDEKYFCIKLLDEIMKSYLEIDELHYIKRCLNCFGSILLKYPNCIIDLIPKIIIRLSENAQIGKTENLVNQLNLFFENCNTVFQKAFDEKNIELINKINVIAKNNLMMKSIVILNPFIFKLKLLKLNANKSSHEKIINGIQSLITNYFIFCSTILNNNLILNNNMITIYIEVIIIYLVENCSMDLIRKYMIKVITKIYRENLLTRILHSLLIDEKGNLKLKTLFFILRYISSDKYNKNNLYFLIKFLESNNKIDKSSCSKIFEFLAKHIINKDTKFFFADFYNDNNNFASTLSNESLNGEEEYVEFYDILNPKHNIKIFKYIFKIFFHCLNESKELDDISNIQKFLTLIMTNMVPLEENNIFQLFKFLVDYLEKIAQLINSQGHKIWQNYLKQYLEILNYTNFYINRKNNEIKAINENYFQILIESYNKILLSLFKLIPNNLSSKDYEILNIIPIIYSSLLCLNILNKNETKENISKNEAKENINKNISYELLNILNNYLTNNKLKTQITLNSCNISLFYIFYYLKNISKKEYFDIIYTIIIRSLNMDEFKSDNTFVNAGNYILIKLCIKILYEQKDYIIKEEEQILSLYDKKYQIIQKLHGIIKQSSIKDKNNNSLDSEDSNKNDKGNSLNIQNFEEKVELINKYLNFSSKSNFIDIALDNKKMGDEKIAKYKEAKDKMNTRYKNWLSFIDMLSNRKNKKPINYKNINESMDILFNSSFSFTENKPIHFISIIKSLGLNNKDFELFSNFFAILGKIIVTEDEIIFRKENIFEKIIYKFDKYLYGVVFVLMKDYFEELDAHLSSNFIVYIKPLSLNGIYLIKIHKNSDFKMKNSVPFKLLTQIDQDFNKIFNNNIILDTNDKKQIDYFYNIIEMIFNYSFLEEQINS